MPTRTHARGRTARALRVLATAAAATALAAPALAPATAAPVPTPSVASTADGPPSAVPAASGTQWLTGYWHNFDNGSVTLPLSQVPQAYNLVAVAFADASTDAPGGIDFHLASSELGGYTEAQFIDDIAALHAQGRKVVLSVGGEKGNVTVSNAAEASSFADSAYALMQEYGFDGVDIDLEHGIHADAMADALHQLADEAGPDLVLTMAPQTIDYQSTSGGYYQLTLEIKDILTIVNTQFYNSGSMLGCDDQVYAQGTVDFLTALSCIELEMGLRPDQVGIGVPAVQQAAGGGYQAPANVVRALDCLEAGTGCGSFTPAEPYGPIGGVMTWSINWDATNDYAFAATVGERLASGPVDVPTDPTDPTDPGDCAAAPWTAAAVYTGGNRASYEGHTYEAKWWTTGENPAQSGQWGVWKDLGAC